MAEEILLYHPSKAMGFGHSANIRNPIKAWDALSNFLDGYTTYQTPTQIQLRYNMSYIKIDKNVEKECIYELQQLFGEGDEGFCHHWSLNSKQLSEALTFIFEINKWKKQKGPPVTLDFQCRFQWKENDTSKLLVGQEEGHNTHDGKLYSYCHCYIDYKVFIQPSLNFPYAYGEDKGMKHLESIKENIPFRFSEKHLRRMLPTKAGHYRYLKICK